MTSSDTHMRNDSTFHVPAGFQQQPSGYRGHRHDIPELGYWRADDDGPMVNTPMSPLSDDYAFEETLEAMHARSEALNTSNIRRMMAAPSLDPRYLSNRLMSQHLLYHNPYMCFSTDEEALWRARSMEMIGPQPTMRMDHLQENLPKARFDPAFGFFNPAACDIMPDSFMRPLTSEAQNLFGAYGEREKKKPSEASSSRRRQELPKTSMDMSHVSFFRNPNGSEDTVDKKGNTLFVGNPTVVGPHADLTALGMNSNKWVTPPLSVTDAWYANQRVPKHDLRAWFSKNEASTHNHMATDLGAFSSVQRGKLTEKGGASASQLRSRMQQKMALGGLSIHEDSAMEAQQLRAGHQETNRTRGALSAADKRAPPHQRAAGDWQRANKVMDVDAFSAAGFAASDALAHQREVAARSNPSGSEDVRAEASRWGQSRRKLSSDSTKMENKGSAHLQWDQDKMKKGKMRSKTENNADRTCHTTKSMRDAGVDWYQASVNALTNNGQKISLEEMFSGKKYLKHLGELGHCQVSCRMLQEKLEMADDRLFNEFLASLLETSSKHETCSQFVELMVDPFGNYLCQKIIDNCNTYQLELLQRTMTPHVLKICLSPHGSRAMQRYVDAAVHRLPKQSLQDFCNGFKNDVSGLVCNQVGNHVITRFLKLLPPKYRGFIYTAVAKNVRQVASNRYGCCVLQRSMDICDASQKHMLCVEICNNALDLIQDPYGNYAVQYVISQKQIPSEQRNEDTMYCGMVCDQIVDHIGMLAMQKFSSNVVERCLERAPPGKLQRMLEEISKPATLSVLAKDSFGNYVVQMALSVAHGPQLETLLVNLEPLLSSAEGPYLQKRVRRKLIKKYPVFAAKLKEGKNPPIRRITESSTSSSPSYVPVDAPADTLDGAHSMDSLAQCTSSDSLVQEDKQTFEEGKQSLAHVKDSEESLGANPDEEQEQAKILSTSENIGCHAPMFVSANSSPQE